jgi:hypothetical protein
MKDPYELIDRAVRAINQAEESRDPYAFIEARRILNNDLRQAIQEHTEQAVQDAFREEIWPA